MSFMRQYIGKIISVEFTGGHHEGALIDFGPDIIVVFDNKKYKYYYIPLAHLQHFKLSPRQDFESVGDLKNSPIISEKGLLFFRNIIEKARDILIELYVTGDRPIYGYITDILNDYILLNSPVYNTMAININHIKWLALTNKNQTFYLKSRNDLQVQATLNAAAGSTFEQHLKKMIGKIIIIDMGMEPHKIGLVTGLSGDFIELVNANEETYLLNINHIKLFY